MQGIGKFLTVAATAGAFFMAASAVAAERAPGVIYNNKGDKIGTVKVTDAPQGVLLRLEASGLPAGWHGLHVHAKGDCSDASFTSAGAHVHAGDEKAVHGLLNKDGNEAGDLPNIHVAADGTVQAELYSTLLSVDGNGDRPALRDDDGSALIIHENVDDHLTQPIGGAGARIGCAIIP